MAIAPATAQLNLREMAGELISWNPDLGYEEAMRIINNWYRRTLSRRNWYSLQTAGQLVTPDAYTTGTVALVANNTLVTGTGTAWDVTFIGRQFRAGFTQPVYTILDVDAAGQVLTLDQVWGGPTTASAGYSSFQSIISLGPKVNMVLTMVNQTQGYPLILHVPRQWVDSFDVWRTSTGWTNRLVDNVPDSSGNPQWELYPSPTVRQTFPYIGYYQPADLVGEDDKPINMIPSDMLVQGALSHALVFRGKNSKYYDLETAKRMRAEYDERFMDMIRIDNQIGQRNMKWDFNAGGAYGGNFNQAHAVYNDGSGDWPS